MTEQVADENLIVEEERYDNPLGFTRETGALLSGLGITNLSKFKKKEINLDDLKDLTEEDLKLLGKFFITIFFSVYLKYSHKFFWYMFHTVNRCR